MSVAEVVFALSFAFAIEKVSLKPLAILVVIVTNPAHLVILPSTHIHVAIEKVATPLSGAKAIHIGPHVDIAIGESEGSLSIHDTVLPFQCGW
jgi:hypothetical protein